MNVPANDADRLASEYAVLAAFDDGVFNVQKVCGQDILAGFLYVFRTVGKLAQYFGFALVFFECYCFLRGLGLVKVVYDGFTQ